MDKYIIFSDNINNIYKNYKAFIVDIYLCSHGTICNARNNKDCLSYAKTERH